MSLYELLSTASEMEHLEAEEKGNPEVSEEDWEGSMELITNLAQFDPSIKLE